MAFQDIKVPRFWVNILPYIHKHYGLGVITPEILEDGTLVANDLNAVNFISLNYRGLYTITPSSGVAETSIRFVVGHQDIVDNDYAGIDIPDIFANVNFFYILGHTFKQHGIAVNVRINYFDLEGTKVTEVLTASTGGDEVNLTNSATGFHAGYDGFSMVVTNGLSTQDLPMLKMQSFEIGFSRQDDGTFNGSTPIEFSSIGLGTYFDMPHAPELNVTYEKSYGGAKKQKTLNGGTLTHFNYSSPPQFGNRGYFELFNADHPLPKTRRTGVRSWGLTFKGITNSTTAGETSLFPQVESFYNFGSDSEDTSYPTNETMFDENTFFGRVVYPTEGGTIPFIFCADNENLNPDQFAVCVFNQKRFRISQSANKIYTVKTEIIESW